MAIAGAAPVYGNFTQTQFDTALSPSSPSPVDPNEFKPVSASEIREMQIKGQRWAQPLILGNSAAAKSAKAPDADALTAVSFVPGTAPAPTPAESRAPEAIEVRPDCHRPSADRHLKSLQRSCEVLSRQIAAAGAGAERPQYAGALRAVKALAQAIVRQQARSPYTGPTTGADAGGGIIAVDLDEAIHGLYTAVAYTKNACANGFGALAESLTRDADLWARNPGAWLTQSAQPHGAADVTIAGIVTFALVPFALMALHAGISEMRESNLHGKTLALEVERSREFLDALRQLSNAFPAASASPFQNLVDAAGQTCKQRLRDLERAVRKNRENGHIGFYSASSGGAIAVKATLDLSAKIGYLGLAGNAAAATLATSVGAAGAILAPIAAASAVGLGAKMVIKSNEALKNFTPVAERLSERLASDTSLAPLAQKTEGKHDYLEFLPRKLAQRRHFFRDYAKKNKRFLLGSSLYAGSALASFGLTAAALAGAGIALGPIGLGVLLAVGIAGGLLMGRYSSQFLFGHGRQHRYENYSIGDDPELDRHFLGTIEAFTDQQAQIANSTGIGLRAAFYRQAARRDELRQDFLGQVAGELGKRYHGALSHSTDSEEVRAQRGGAPTAWRVIRAAVQKKYEGIAGYSHAGMRYLGGLLRSGNHAAAKAAAGALRQENKPYLSVVGLHEWMSRGANYSKQMVLMHDCLRAQIDYLKDKSDLRVRMYALANNLDVKKLSSPENADANPDDAAAVDTDTEAHMEALLNSLAEPLARDAALRSQAEALCDELSRGLSREPDRDPDQSAPPGIPEQKLMAQTASRFLSLQCGLPCDPEAEAPDIRQSQAALAYYFLKEAPGRYRNLRGMLVDTELQATRLAWKNAPDAASR